MAAMRGIKAASQEADTAWNEGHDLETVARALPLIANLALERGRARDRIMAESESSSSALRLALAPLRRTVRSQAVKSNRRLVQSGSRCPDEAQKVGLRGILGRFFGAPNESFSKMNRSS